MSLATNIEPEVLCELRVLQGRARGAVAKLARRRWVEVGHALSSDLVIRDASAKGVRLRLRPRDDTAELDLIEGEVVLLGHPLAAPATAILPAYVPLELGDTAVALGVPDSPRWSEAERLLDAAHADTDTSAAAEAAEGAQARAALPPWRVLSPALLQASRLQVLVPVTIGAAAAVVLAAVGWNLTENLLDRAPSPARASQVLAQDGFPSLEIRTSDEGLVARGLLTRASDLERLRADVARRHWPIALTVQTNDQLRQGVADVLRANGYDATIKAMGPGLFSAQLRGGDPSRQDEVRDEALRDNPGLKQLVLVGQDGQPASHSLAPSDAGKRVVTVVGGDMGYVQTADGSRYFAGATLPTGHKILAVADQDVTLELDGKTTHLKF